MCLSAIHWAKIERVVFGATIGDAADAGFHELFVPAKELAAMGRSPVKVESGLLQAECASLFDEWKRSGKARAY
jgi:tRNA(Arg) A34 adenosine deaminase TadA